MVSYRRHPDEAWMLTLVLIGDTNEKISAINLDEEYV